MTGWLSSLAFDLTQPVNVVCVESFTLYSGAAYVKEPLLLDTNTLVLLAMLKHTVQNKLKKQMTISR